MVMNADEYTRQRMLAREERERAIRERRMRQGRNRILLLVAGIVALLAALLLFAGCVSRQLRADYQAQVAATEAATREILCAAECRPSSGLCNPPAEGRVADALAAEVDELCIANCVRPELCAYMRESLP